jgi:hypothetical protein
MFKKWNFRKNIAAKEWSSINRCIENRRVVDKDSTIIIGNGNIHVNPKRIERARARYSSQTSQELVSHGTAGLLPLAHLYIPSTLFRKWNKTSLTAIVPLQNLDSRPNAHSYGITVRTPPPPDSGVWHKFPANLPWFCFLSKYNNTCE